MDFEEERLPREKAVIYGFSKGHEDDIESDNVHVAILRYFTSDELDAKMIDKSVYIKNSEFCSDWWFDQHLREPLKNPGMSGLDIRVINNSGKEYGKVDKVAVRRVDTKGRIVYLARVMKDFCAEHGADEVNVTPEGPMFYGAKLQKKVNDQCMHRIQEIKSFKHAKNKLVPYNFCDMFREEFEKILLEQAQYVTSSSEMERKIARKNFRHILEQRSSLEQTINSILYITNQKYPYYDLLIDLEVKKAGAILSDKFEEASQLKNRIDLLKEKQTSSN